MTFTLFVPRMRKTFFHSQSFVVVVFLSGVPLQTLLFIYRGSTTKSRRDALFALFKSAVVLREVHFF